MKHELSVLKWCLDDVRGPDELGNEAINGREIDFAGRADLGDRALAHDNDAIAEFHCLGLIVGHVDCGDAKRPQQAVELAAEPLAKGGIKCGQRLVEQQDAGPDRNRARERHALALAAGKLVDASVLKASDVGQRDKLGDARGALLLRDAADFQPITDILGDAHVRKQRVGLKHHADIAPLDRDRRHVLAVEQHLAAGIGQFEAGNDS